MKKPRKSVDLEADEETNVRTALKFLRTRCGGWRPLSKVLRFDYRTLSKVASGEDSASASMAVRIAKLAKVGVDDVLTGRYPAPGACPHCGHCPGTMVQ
jgi:hypothetical protein